MRDTHFARLSPVVVLAAAMLFVSPARAQLTPSNPFTTSPPAALQPTAPFSTPGLTPAWDPYATPGAASAQPVLPPAGTAPYGVAPYGATPQPTLGYPAQDWASRQVKLIQNVTLKGSWLAPEEVTGFGMTNVETSAALAIPFFYNLSVAPVIITPGFNFHFLEGPQLPPPQDLPSTVYDGFLQLSWQPQLSPRFATDLAVSVGYYSDFSYADETAIRILGRGVGIWTFGPHWKAVGGVVYLDRLEVKFLPVAGFIWTPHDDSKFELVFPSPKLAQRITIWGKYEVWGYLGAEYGGGQWAIEHANGLHDEVNYNDIRVFAGVEALGVGACRMFFEGGYVMKREILYRSGAPTFEPEDTYMIRGGVSF